MLQCWDDTEQGTLNGASNSIEDAYSHNDGLWMLAMLHCADRLPSLLFAFKSCGSSEMVKWWKARLAYH